MWRGLNVIKVFSVSLFSMLVTLPALADEPVGKPNVHVNDIWIYNLTDGFTNDVTGKIGIRVVQIDEKEIVAKHERLDGASNRNWLVYYDDVWNNLDNGTFRFEPSLVQVRFPASVGEEWSSEYRSINFKSGDSLACTNKTKAVSSEKITVPAGTFDTIRFDVSSECNGAGTDKTLYKSTTSIWYATAVNRYVKTTYASIFNGRVRAKSSEELVEYSPGK